MRSRVDPEHTLLTLVSPDEEGLAEEASQVIFGCIEDALRRQRAALVVLAGGAALVGAYRALAHQLRVHPLDLERIRWLLRDENDPVARRVLLDAVGVPRSRIVSWSAAPPGSPDLAVLGMSAEDQAILPEPFQRFLAGSRCVAFLASGAQQAEAVRRARAGDPSVPAGRLRGQRTLFLVTRDAMGPELPNYRGNVSYA